MKEKTFTTPTHAETDDGMTDFMLQAFDHACNKDMNQELKDEALRLVRLYIGNPDADEHNPLFGMVSGFMLGMNEGMNVADTLNGIADENKTTANASTLEDISAELEGVSRTLCCLVELIRPKEPMQDCNVPTETTIESAFFAVECQLDRIADHLTEIADGIRKPQPRPTKARIAV